MESPLFVRYAAVQSKYEELERERQALRSQIVEVLKAEGVTKEETQFGIFTVATRTSYEYTDAVKKLEEKVKLAKVKEEKKGVAKPKTTEYMVFTAPKA